MLFDIFEKLLRRQMKGYGFVIIRVEKNQIILCIAAAQETPPILNNHVHSGIDFKAKKVFSHLDNYRVDLNEIDLYIRVIFTEEVNHAAPPQSDKKYPGGFRDQCERSKHGARIIKGQ